MTATNRNTDEPHSLFYMNGLFREGFDFKHNWKDRKYFVAGNIVGSHISGSKNPLQILKRKLRICFKEPMPIMFR